MLSDSAVAVLTALLLASVEAEQPFPRSPEPTAEAVEEAAYPADPAKPEPTELEAVRYLSSEKPRD